MVGILGGSYLWCGTFLCIERLFSISGPYPLNASSAVPWINLTAKTCPTFANAPSRNKIIPIRDPLSFYLRRKNLLSLWGWLQAASAWREGSLERWLNKIALAQGLTLYSISLTLYSISLFLPSPAGLFPHFGEWQEQDPADGKDQDPFEGWVWGPWIRGEAPEGIQAGDGPPATGEDGPCGGTPTDPRGYQCGMWMAAWSLFLGPLRRNRQ